jgi:excisionase family DNA binding protein
VPRARQQPDQLTLLKPPKPTRAERSAQMDEEILDVDGAARALGVSTRTIYNLARKGEIPAMRVGREWRFALTNLREWVANASQADQVAAALRNGRIVRKRK